MARVVVAIVGASGYTGGELLRLLAAHPAVEIGPLCAHGRAGEPVAQVLPQLAGHPLGARVLEPFDVDVVAKGAGVAFLALPHGEAGGATIALRERGLRVLDLSADLRLKDAAAHREFYGEDAAPALRAEAVYGLPELHRGELRGANLVAVPGCYPTTAILALTPLVRAGLVATTGLVIDAKSGVSGAGRRPTAGVHFAEIGEGVRAYKIGGAHRHTPEIEQELSRVAGHPVRVTFTPHLVPMTRGILATCYGTPTDSARKAGDYKDALAAAYDSEPFVVVRPMETPPDTAHVRGSNRVHVSATYDARAGRVIALAALDNLVKGAAGQAVQCLNLMMGWPETAGLDLAPMFP